MLRASDCGVEESESWPSAMRPVPCENFVASAVRPKLTQC